MARMCTGWLTVILLCSQSSCGIAPASYSRVDPTPISVHRAVSVKAPTSPSTEIKQPKTVVATAPDDTGITDKHALKHNVCETGTSNFQEAHKEHITLEERFLLFDSDSIKVKPENINYLSVLMKRFATATDLFSIIGYSNGPTKLPGGNALLALGRAEAVKQVLHINGVPIAQIFDEACWSNYLRTGEYPNRGVLIALKRKI